MTIAGKQSQVIIFLFENKSTTPSTPRNNGTPKAQARTARKFWTRSRCWSYCHCYLTCILWNRGLQCGKHRPKRRHLVVCLLCYMSKWHATAASQHRCPFELAPTAIVHAIKSYLWGVAILKCAALSVVILLMSSYQPTHESSCSKTRLVVYYHLKKRPQARKPEISKVQSQDSLIDVEIWWKLYWSRLLDGIYQSWTEAKQNLVPVSNSRINPASILGAESRERNSMGEIGIPPIMWVTTRKTVSAENGSWTVFSALEMGVLSQTTWLSRWLFTLTQDAGLLTWKC